VAQIDPVPGITDPMFLRAWQQAQLEQQAFERHGANAAKGRRRPALAQPEPQPSVEDGFRDGDQGFLRTLQGLLRQCLNAAGSPDRLSRGLAEQLAMAPDPLHEAALAHPGDLGEAITWLVDNLHRPYVVSSGCAQLGPALAELLDREQEPLEALGPTVTDALRASLGAGWRSEYGLAWESMWGLVAQWIRQGMETVQFEPPFWTGVVVSHDRRRADVAVLRLRTHLPYPFHAGQYTVVESMLRPEVWRPFWIASPPAPDHVIEVHVQAAGDGVAGALVHRTAAGDRIRLRPPGGDLALPPPSEHALLLVAGGVGVAPMKALLAELRASGDERVVHLFWGVRHREDLYDLEAMRALGATVVPVVAEGPAYPYHSGLVPEVVAAHGDWHANDVCVTGSRRLVEATVEVLTANGVPREHISTGTTESTDTTEALADPV
jgi:NAD(P)H-flavin reductase